MSDEPEPRYERKFVVEGVGAAVVRDAVMRHGAMFSEAYPPRRVNNLYLDTPARRSYSENLFGAGSRVKARVRWYGDLFGDIDHPVLEFKIKSGLVGWKESHPLAPFAIGGSFHARRFARWLGGVDLPPSARARLLGCRPALVNSYHRRYFADLAGFRLTIDDDLWAYRVHPTMNRFLAHVRDRTTVIVELKYPRHLELTAQRVAGAFSFRVARNSKYVSGLAAVEPGFG